MRFLLLAVLLLGFVIPDSGFSAPAKGRKSTVHKKGTRKGGKKGHHGSSSCPVVACPDANASADTLLQVIAACPEQFAEFRATPGVRKLKVLSNSDSEMVIWGGSGELPIGSMTASKLAGTNGVISYDCKVKIDAVAAPPPSLQDVDDANSESNGG